MRGRRQLVGTRSERLVQRQRERPIGGDGRQLGVEPGPLLGLGIEPGAEQLDVEPDQRPAVEVERPGVGTDHVEPAAPALGGDDRLGALGRRRVVAHVVVARYGVPRDGEAVEPGASVVEIGGDTGPVERQVAEVQHEVGRGALDVGDDGVPVGVGFGSARRQVRVRHHGDTGLHVDDGTERPSARRLRRGELCTRPRCLDGLILRWIELDNTACAKAEARIERL